MPAFCCTGSGCGEGGNLPLRTSRGDESNTNHEKQSLKTSKYAYVARSDDVRSGQCAQSMVDLTCVRCKKTWFRGHEVGRAWKDHPLLTKDHHDQL